MDASQEEIVNHRAIVSARALFGNVCITLVSMGLHLFMALYGLSVFLETPRQLRKGRHRYIVISFVITILVTLNGSLETAWFFQQIFTASSGLKFVANVNKNSGAWTRMADLSSIALIMFLGDALLVYRCYVIWSQQWWVVVPPAMACVATLALSFYQIAVFSSTNASGAQPYELSRVYLTIGTNVLVTALISFHLLRARRRLSQLLPSKDMKLYTGVVAILIESALPLTVVGIVYAGLETATLKSVIHASADQFLAAYFTFVGLFYNFCGLSPHMIIFRVTTGRSWLKFPEQHSNGEDALSNPINFAHEATGTSSDLESDSHGAEKASIQRNNGSVAAIP